jgi:lysozyme
MDLRTQLIRDEGCRLEPYKDQLGNWTIGVGHLLTPYELEIYRNGITQEQADDLLAGDISNVEEQLAGFAWYTGLDLVRQGAICNMVFNLGISRFLGFKNLITCLTNKDWVGARKAALNSLWAMQVGPRAQRLGNQLAIGEWQ